VFILLSGALRWLYCFVAAIKVASKKDIESLGSQGDIWDAQKDMLADTLGAITSLLLFWVVRQNLKQN